MEMDLEGEEDDGHRYRVGLIDSVVEGISNVPWPSRFNII